MNKSLVALLLWSGALAGCTSQTQLREAELGELLHWLPGQYDNLLQVKEDAVRGVRPPHEALALSVIPLDNPLLGTFVFYVQESAADDPLRVMAQRIWTFEASDKGIVQSVWTLAEPLRWREGEHDPDLLRSMMKQDVVQTQGCDLHWTKSGSRFLAQNDPKRCQSTSRATGGTIHIDSRFELESSELGLSETGADGTGQVVQGRFDEPFYRFHRRS